MLLTLSTTASNAFPRASDLGYLLHKHPDKAQAADIAFGRAHVLWPAASEQRSTVALLLEVDPVALVRGCGKPGQAGQAGQGFSLTQYVNDRPYAASSMLAVALGKLFRTAMAGRCDARPELVDVALALEVRLPVVPTRGGSGEVERLFGPLGWEVDLRELPLDETIPAWGSSRYVDLRLTGTMPLAAALTHLYVLVPVLDDAKHYWVSADEVDKLLRAGGAWLAEHPGRDLITRRHLRHQPSLVQDAVGRLAEVDDADPDALPAEPDDPPRDEPAEPAAPLARLRLAAVLEALHTEGASSVVDLGCGEGALLRALVADPGFSRVLGVDVSHRALELADRRLHLDRMPDSQRARLELLQSSAVYRDDRIGGQDAVVLMEVVEHLDPPRLPALVRNVFGHAHPSTVVVTTPNAEHNVRYEHLPAGTLRHPDHRFEWTRAELRTWAEATAAAYGYTVRYAGVGDDDPEVGPPTQLAVFRRVA